MPANECRACSEDEPLTALSSVSSRGTNKRRYEERIICTGAHKTRMQESSSRVMWFGCFLLAAQTACFSCFAAAWSCWSSSRSIVDTTRTPRMFLNGEFPRKASVWTANRDADERATRLPPVMPRVVDDPSERRVLGFDIISLGATPSKVNLDAWKDGDASVSRIAWRAKDDTDSLSEHLEVHSSAPGPLAWTPTRSRIDSLKIADLKLACQQRGLSISGNKASMRERLWNWTVEQKERQEVKITGDFLSRYFEESNSAVATGTSTSTITITGTNSGTDTGSDIDTDGRSGAMDEGGRTPDSLADWVRNLDIEPLLQKRKEIHRQKREGRPLPKKKDKTLHKQATAEYLKSLARALRAPSSPYSSNIQVRELYAASKQADQLGERLVAIDLLQTLLMVTPNDARVHRRLARIYIEQGDIEKARQTLETGLTSLNENPWLWHGLGNLERMHGTYAKAKECFEKAIELDPKFAQSYHALGTMEHTQGHVANAMRVIKKGIDFCPSNHRLWHAYGDVYRAAQMFDDAERSYKKALHHSPQVSHCFSFSALAAVAYEQGSTDKARRWLSQAVKVNHGRHAQGWVALAQLEEAEGNIEKARLLSAGAIAQYERGLVNRMQKKLQRNEDAANSRLRQNLSLEGNSTEISDRLLRTVPSYRSGDKFVHVYQNWAGLEERHGSHESIDRVYRRACTAFPRDYKLLLSWGRYHARAMSHERARSIFQEACQVAGHRNADPYRIAAELEVSLSNYYDARKILFLGARAITQQNRTSLGDENGLSHLLHTWAICEWHVGNLDRAQDLFDHALRLSRGKETPLRSFILYSIARLKHYKGEQHLAQHYVGLALMDNCMPGGNAKLWAFWAKVADEMEDSKLKEECLQQAGGNGGVTMQEEDVAYLLNSSKAPAGNLFPHVPVEKCLIRRDPWKLKLFGMHTDALHSFQSVKFPRTEDRHPSESVKR